MRRSLFFPAILALALIMSVAAYAALKPAVTSPALRPAVANAAFDFPRPQGYVSDFASMLSPEARASLETRLADFESKTGNEIAVVTIENLRGTDVEDYAVRLFEEWKIGKKDKDNGVLLLVSKEERKIRIEVGYGLEPNLTDVQASRIIRETISPAFKQGDYDRGFEEGVSRITGAVTGEKPVPNEDPRDSGSKRSLPGNFLVGILSILAFLGIGIIQWLVAILGRTKSWWLGGVLGAIVGMAILFLAGIAIGVLAVIILSFIGLLLDFKVSKGYKKGVENESNPPWWAGGGWGPGAGGSGGGGFGGFGGGGSGGGGASGDW